MDQAERARSRGRLRENREERALAASHFLSSQFPVLSSQLAMMDFEGCTRVGNESRQAALGSGSAPQVVHPTNQARQNEC